MSFPPTRLLSVLALVATLASPPARASDSVDPTELAEAYFEQLFGFDGIEAYESMRGPARASFVIARRWSAGSAKVLFDVLAPVEFSRWAMLLEQNLEHGDDVFLYIHRTGGPLGRRVVRLPPAQVQAHVLFEMLPVGEFRPVSAGELIYTRLPDVVLHDELCVVVEGRPRHPGLGFDRVELAISELSGMALRTRYFHGQQMSRQIRVEPQDLRKYGDRYLPMRRHVLVPPSTAETQLVLRNVVLDAQLPRALFTRHNLRIQRFPHF